MAFDEVSAESQSQKDEECAQLAKKEYISLICCSRTGPIVRYYKGGIWKKEIDLSHLFAHRIVKHQHFPTGFQPY